MSSENLVAPLLENLVAYHVCWIFLLNILGLILTLIDYSRESHDLPDQVCSQTQIFNNEKLTFHLMDCLVLHLMHTLG